MNTWKKTVIEIVSLTKYVLYWEITLATLKSAYRLWHFYELTSYTLMLWVLLVNITILTSNSCISMSKVNWLILHTYSGTKWHVKLVFQSQCGFRFLYSYYLYLFIYFSNTYCDFWLDPTKFARLEYIPVSGVQINKISQ